MHDTEAACQHFTTYCEIVVRVYPADFYQLDSRPKIWFDGD